MGGGLGSVLRYLVQVYTIRYASVSFPLGTLVINIAGCFTIGLLYGLSNKYLWLTLEWRLFLITGICGGFTTFSSFSYESISLFKQGNYVYFLFYVFLSVIIGLLATLGGSALIK